MYRNENRRWFCGTVQDYNEADDLWLVEYDDGAEHQESLRGSDQLWDLLDEEPPTSAAVAAPPAIMQQRLPVALGSPAGSSFRSSPDGGSDTDEPLDVVEDSPAPSPTSSTSGGVGSCWADEYYEQDEMQDLEPEQTAIEGILFVAKAFSLSRDAAGERGAGW